ncbi:uncharacterized protein LOC109136286 [Beta vulgaris subsp. vulgaris]|uniref:uncharacterized protein LOC109136286 n=1 Tax=Beta vulgaris subsp. vulgaris TaxID=3555 RepID=UPI000900665B|nr:uncharacterized protein LOC109136286 [Beta vulgaris subsp. vulgaris]
MTTIEVISPLYLHLSGGNNFMAIDKLQGSRNYKSWKRYMEIVLASKRNLGFVTRSEKKNTTDNVKGEAWETCNSMIISWILGSVSESIKKSTMFVNSAHIIWKQLEQRFALTNWSRKYKLNKELYKTKQQEKSISDYYTIMRSTWGELEASNSLPPIITVTVEVNEFVKALNLQQEQQKLFQFLNGLDEAYRTHMSQILMMTPLPSVESACSYLEQEEAQREILGKMTQELVTLAMYNKGTRGEYSGNQGIT